MTPSKPNLDDLIAAQRAGGGMTEAQRKRNRAQLLSRALAGTAASAASVSAAATVPGSAPFGALGVIAKVALGVLLIGGAGAVYRVTRSAVVRSASESATASAKNPAAAIAAPATPTAVESAPAEATVSAAALASAAPIASSAKPRVPRSAITSAPPSLAREVALMHEVDSALRAGQPERALLLLDEQGSGGFMAEERAVAQIVTLCQLGRVDRARVEGARFLRDRPHSPLAARVRASCVKPAESGASGLPD